MFNHSYRMTVALSAVIFTLPAAARGQTGILHKRSPAVIQSLPASMLPSAPVATAKPLPRPGGPALLTPIDGDSIVHALPIPGKPGAAAGFGSGAVKAPSTGFSGPRPDGLERAAAVASNFASSGLERASTATSAASAISPRGSRSVQSGPAVAAPVQRVGQVPTTSGPRWRDRLRFSWVGGE